MSLTETQIEQASGDKAVVEKTIENLRAHIEKNPDSDVSHGLLIKYLYHNHQFGDALDHAENLYFDQPGDIGFSGTYLSLLNQFAADGNKKMIAKAHANFIMLGTKESFMAKNFLAWQRQFGYSLPEPDGPT